MFGLGIELEGLVPRKLFGQTIHNEPVETANRTASFLKNELGCHYVICLSHLGYKYEQRKICDLDLAKDSLNIDVIIGGHTHTFLEKPVEETNADGKTVLINQVGWAGINLGRIDFHFEKSKFEQEELIRKSDS